MYLYSFSWAWFEDNIRGTLSHKDDYSEKEFAIICREALKESVLVLLKADGFIGLNNLRDSAYQLLLKEYGFTEPKITGYYLWGAYIIDKTDNKRDYGDSECAKEILGAELFNKVVKHNKRVDREDK